LQTGAKDWNLNQPRVQHLLSCEAVAGVFPEQYEAGGDCCPASQPRQGSGSACQPQSRHVEGATVLTGWWKNSENEDEQSDDADGSNQLNHGPRCR